MEFSSIIGQQHIKKHLIQTIRDGRIPHAQLFVGKAGSGVLPTAIAYAKEILCSAYEKGSPEYTVCAAKVSKLAHPDLHFIYPVNTNDSVKKHPVSRLFLEDWRTFIASNMYGSLFEWLQQLGIENKQGNINVDEAQDMLKTLSLKSYEGGYKVMILWMADKMNAAASNKLLKLVEEPPDKTVLLLLTESEEQIIATIRSRCQKLDFPRLSETEISSQLIENQKIKSDIALKISQLSNGDYNRALQLLGQDGDSVVFEKWFITWVRAAFSAKGNKKAINQLITWSESIAKEGRETQKKFLLYCIETFRQALLKSYKADSLLFFTSTDPKFSIDKFAPFVHQNNIYDINEALDSALYHIERNGNAKIIFTDLSIRLTRLIHRKQ